MFSEILHNALNPSRSRIKINLIYDADIWLLRPITLALLWYGPGAKTASCAISTPIPGTETKIRTDSKCPWRHSNPDSARSTPGRARKL